MRKNVANKPFRLTFGFKWYIIRVQPRKEGLHLRYKNRLGNRLCAALAVIAVALCSGCTQPDGGEVTSVTVVSESAPEVTTLHAEALANEEDVQPSVQERPLKIAASNYSYTYSPFYSDGDFDALINNLTGTRLLGLDRSGKAVTKGINGERRMYAGSYYLYTGIADVDQKYDEEADETVYSIRLRDDVKFSDGETMDADDLIFTFYMLLDPSFSKRSPFQGVNIKGAINYRLNSTIADTLSSEDIIAALETEDVQQKIRSDIVEPMLRRELEWVKSLYGDASYSVYTAAYPEAKDLMAFFYSVNSEYDSTAVSEEQVLSDLADMYGGNYELLGSMYEGDSAFFKTDAEICAIEYLSEEKGACENVDSISGIIKTGKNTVDVTVSSSGTGFISALNNVIVAPLHYYGDESGYDYAANKFGFEKGTALELATNKADAPLGAGAYAFERSENGVAYLTANEYYYKGVPKTKKLEISQTSSDSAVSAVSDGIADLSYPEASAEASDQIEEANGAIEKLYACTINSDGYGYIGINAKTVNVGGEAESAESIALRKALATAIYLFRDESVHNYYGDIGIAVDFPASVSGYIKTDSEELSVPPYSKNAAGELIYSEGMNEQVRRSEAKQACLGYLEAAGYTIENNRVTAAPENGTTTFHAIIAAEGTGRHPSYYALEAASALLREIGITLVISDAADAAQLWSVLNSGTQEIWASVWETGAQPRFSSSEMYGADNLCGISGKDLSDAAAAADNAEPETVSDTYTALYSLLYDKYAVEIPMYQRSGCILFSTLRINTNTLPKNMTGYYGWVDEAEKITQKM